MAKTIFINLPVANAARAAQFYEAIGFTRDPRYANPQAESVRWSDDVSLMLIEHAMYATFTPKRIIDPRAESGMLLALTCDSREGVDAICEAAYAAGGREAHGPEDHGFMYSRAFEDLDGHGWGPFCMDMAAFEAMRAGEAQPG